MLLARWSLHVIVRNKGIGTERSVVFDCAAWSLEALSKNSPLEYVAMSHPMDKYIFDRILIDAHRVVALAAQQSNIEHPGLKGRFRELLIDGYIPSFCTACYRLGRTGEQFMEFSIPGFIQNLCTPNALTTLLEYLIDYATPETRALGQAAIEREIDQLPESQRKRQLLDRLDRIRRRDERDLPF